ncbi:MAG: prolipoprotein diacylglyceryl transferase [Prochlorothrix sp.]|nr:prolipoprotein diacylglyceryl transferase [Prochlorothrix sp.]
MYPPVDPIVFEIGPFALRWYGLLMVSAIFIGSSVASQYLGKKGEDPDDFWDMLVWVLIPALLGARLYYVFIQSPRGPAGLEYYLAHPGSIFRIWEGGIHIFGAFIAGGIAVWLYTKVRNLPLWTYLDAIGLALPLSQAIGRWGNFINQELYGPPTRLPWGLRIDPVHRIAPFNDLVTFPDSTRFQPLFLYESLWNFLGFALIYWISRRFQRQLQPGDLIFCYLLWYPLGRFGLEFLRTDSWFFPGTPFNVVHILCAIAIGAAGLVLYSRHGDNLRRSR